MFDHLYRDELASLREAGAALAARQPELAAMLASPGDDPDVERLLQGFAFVAARLRARIEAAAPELVEALLARILPSALRPMPAATIVAFQVSGPRRGVRTIARGTPLRARDASGTHSTFTTTRELTLLPIDLIGVRLDPKEGATPTLTLRLHAEGDATWAQRGQALRLHLHGDAGLADQLGLWLARHVRSARIRGADGRELVLGGAETVRQVGLDADDALVPWPAFAPPSTRLLEESFALPAKHRFFDVHGLARAAPLLGGAFEVVLTFDRPPPLHARLPDDLVRLHCVPAVNLFHVDAEPLHADLAERPQLLRAAGIDPAHMEVFDVRSVTGIGAAGARVVYPAADALGASTAAGRYALTRRPSPVDDGIHTYLTVHRHLASARAQTNETLSVALTCTNRDLTRALGVGDVHVATAHTPADVAFSNITPITAPRRPPRGSAQMWQLVAWLACSRRGLADAESLRSWLALHAGRGGPVDDPRIAAVETVEAGAVTRAFGGVPVRGSRYQVALARAGFASEGEAHAFGALIHQVLAVDARFNEFVDLTVTLRPSGMCFDYAGVPR